MIDSGAYRETQGPNRSPAIDALAREFGVPLGSPWCAMFACKAAETARDSGEDGDAFPMTAGSQDLLHKLTAMGCQTSLTAQSLLSWKGAAVIRTDPDGAHGHVALVKERLTDASGIITAIVTCEGNTDVLGSSNGDGAYNRHRWIPLAPYKWTFVRLDNFAGGDWWG